MSRWAGLVGLAAVLLSGRVIAADATPSSSATGTVDHFVGEYREAIKIDVPAFHGLEPGLSLAYSSSSGNGFVGVGWSLTGLGIVERASPGRGAPRYDGSDIYILDGQELVPCAPGSVSPSCTTGGTHSTKIESYARIAFDGTSWIVTGKNGTRVTYVPVYAGVFRWGPSSVVDTHGNTVSYGWWCDPSADCYLDSVQYNGTVVRLYREGRPDPLDFATGGGVGRTNYRLKSIDVTVSGQRRSAYKLQYTTTSGSPRSLLSGVQLYGRDASVDGAGNVTGATWTQLGSFSYSNAAVGLSAPTQRSSFYDPSWNSDPYWSTIRFVDVNGDGKADICGRAAAGINCSLSDGTNFSTTLWSTTFSDANGWASPQHYSTIDYPDINGDGKADVCGLANGNLLCELSTGSSFASAVLSTDFGDCQSPQQATFYATSGRAGFIVNQFGATSGGALGYQRLDTGYNNTWIEYPWYLEESRAYVSFDSSSLPDGKPLLAASLGLCRWGGPGGAPAYLYKTSFAVPLGDAWAAPVTYVRDIQWTPDGYHTFGLPVSTVSRTGETQFEFRYSTTPGYPNWNGQRYCTAQPCICADPYATPQLSVTYCGDAAMHGWTTDEKYYKTIRYVDVNGDGKADVCGRGADGIWCALSTGTGFTGYSRWLPNFGDSDPGWGDDPDYWSSIRYPDINGDGKADICARGFDGIWCALSTGAGFGPLNIMGPRWSNAAGWKGPAYRTTIQYADVNGDGKADVCARESTGMFCALSTGNGFATPSPWSSGIDFSDAQGWAAGPQHYTTIALVDLDGDGRADVCGRGVSGTYCAYSLGTGFGPGSLWQGANFRDDQGWASQPYYYSTISYPDINGDGRPDVCGRSGAGGVYCGTNGNALPSVLLTSGANSAGGTTTISYTPSTAWANTNNLAKKWTTSAVTRADGRGNSSTTQYSYSGGLYDALERRFLGFRYVKETKPCITGEAQCPYNETWFKQDYGSVSKPERIDRRSGAGILHGSTIFEYTTNGATLPYTSLGTGTWNYEYDGSASPVCPGAGCRRTYVAQSFDAYGNAVSVMSYGDYDVAGDEQTATLTFIPNTASYIVGLPSDARSYHGIGTGGALLSQTLKYYDGATSWTAAATKGDVTQTLQWLNTTQSYIAAQVEYDVFGNATATVDPLGARTTTTYDAVYHAFSTSTTNALSQSGTATWDAVCGVPVEETDANGASVSHQYL